jgi:hypothetical protein
MNAVIQQPTLLETIRLPRKLKPEEERRVETLGKLNDRYMKAVAAGDARALTRIARRYARLGSHGGCPMRASAIRAEAAYLRRSMGRKQ